MDTLIRINTASNILRAGAKESIEKQLREHLQAVVPDIISREAELPSYITAEVRFYSNLMEEARECYKFGLFHAAVSMIGISAERFTMEIYEQMEVKINNKILEKEKVLGKKLKQYLRLKWLLEAELINDSAYRKLKDINDIRNKYIHPREIGDAREDSLKAINLFNEIIKSRFSEKYEIKEGRIMLRKSVLG